MVICVLIPRFSLIAACSEDWEVLRQPAALAPETGGKSVIGEVSRAAEAFGVVAGMRMGEALARCPEIRLLPPDPVRAATLWDRVLGRLEGIGAEVESERSGEAFFEADGLLRLHGGTTGLFAATRRAAGRQRAIGAAVRIAAAPTRFAARLAAIQAEDGGDNGGRHDTGDGRKGTSHRLDSAPIEADQLLGFLAPLPITALAGEPDIESRLTSDLQRLGIDTLSALAAIPAGQVADRFGQPGLRARRLACGEDNPLRPRSRPEPLEQTLELPDSLDGSQLSHALELLIDRFLAMPERQDRMLRSLMLSATLASGGSWRCRVALNRPSGTAETLRLALIPRLDALPGPAGSLTLRALELGAGAPDQDTLAPRQERQRRARLAEAVRQTRASAGPDSLLRVLTLNPDARLPEHRLTLTPFEVPEKPKRRRA